MLDFIFGDMVADQERIEKYRRRVRGVRHLSRREPLRARPGDAVRLTLSVGPNIVVQDAFLYYTVDGTDPLGTAGVAEHGSVVKMNPISTAWNMPEWGYIQDFQAEVPPQRSGTVVRYRMSVVSPSGEEIIADDGAYYAYHVDEYEPPAWAREAIIYHILVDRFSPGDGNSWQAVNDVEDVYGGTLRGIHENLDHIAGLGANTVYMSPLFPCSSHHGYDSTDYFEIEPRFGTKQEFKALLDALHERGMRFIMDFVPNHWSCRHHTFQDALSNPDSPYRDWYIFQEYPEEYDCFFKVREMPKINLRNPQARAHILDAARYWLEFGVDGFRIDYAIGPTPDFWADLRAAAKETSPDCWIFGEVIDPPDSQQALVGLLDGCLDFHLLEYLRQVFATKKWDMTQFAAFLQKHFHYFDRDFILPSMLDNHDMDRFLWIADNQTACLRMAAMVQCALPNPPMLYYGTEVGLSQNVGIRDEYGGFGHLGEARLPMLWGAAQDRELYAYFQQLFALRKELGLSAPGELHVDAASIDHLALTLCGAQTCQLLVNRSGSSIEVECGDGFSKALCSSPEGKTSTSDQGVCIFLPAYSATIVYG